MKGRTPGTIEFHRCGRGLGGENSFLTPGVTFLRADFGPTVAPSRSSSHPRESWSFLKARDREPARTANEEALGHSVCALHVLSVVRLQGGHADLGVTDLGKWFISVCFTEERRKIVHRVKRVLGASRGSLLTGPGLIFHPYWSLVHLLPMLCSRRT